MMSRSHLTINNPRKEKATTEYAKEIRESVPTIRGAEAEEDFTKDQRALSGEIP